MLISSVLREIQRVYAPLDARPALPPREPGEAAAPRRYDRVTLSASGARMAAALAAARAAPDVRQERVDEAQSSIAAGRYVVRERDIAAALLKEGQKP